MKGACLVVLLVLLQRAAAQGDSLASAIEAIDRRTRDLEDYEDNEYGYTLNAPDEVAFLKTYGSEKPYGYGKPEINYVDDAYDPELYSKRIPSAFRERVEQDNQKQLEELSRLISMDDNKVRYAGGDYEDMIRQLWNVYRKPHVKNTFRSPKRYYYPQLGLDSVALAKRNSFTDETIDDAYIRPSEDFEDEDDEDYSTNALRKRFDRTDYKIRKLRAMYGSNPYSKLKRFPLAKRSNSYQELAKEMVHEQKPTTTKKQTDPKVEKELNYIFGNKKDEVTTTAAVITTPEPTNKTGHKEEYPPMALISQKPLQIKKKSIDWSDYFGLDRRKKSDSDDLDKEWLIERYHKSVALTKKRAAELPLSSFKNHDGSVKKDSERKRKSSEEEETKTLTDIDNKLKGMEDEIVDDALKYTGAHEGTADPKEIQQVKDKIISRLAAAYSLEKMRNALEEYKVTISKQRQKAKNDEYLFTEEKRVAVPRKQVVEEDIPEGDNAIQCAEGEEGCHKQNYRTPSEVIESHFGTEECPAIERACNDVATVIGQYGEVLRSACTMHQMCLLCSNNSWFSPTRQCNTLYLDKTYDLCKGNMSCQKVAQRSVRYLIDVHRSLHIQPSDVNDCELSCPDIDENRR